ncbi:hypothetical protein ACJX0J_020452, partial [Zea mays]
FETSGGGAQCLVNTFVPLGRRLPFWDDRDLDFENVFLKNIVSFAIFSYNHIFLPYHFYFVITDS